MKQFIDKKQKIVATCILQKGTKVLLLRGNQLTDEKADTADTGYFDVPRFEINFGDSPELMIKKYFSRYFNHEITSVKVADVRQNIIDERAEQIFEIIYYVQCDEVFTGYERQEVFFFADVFELESYMFSDQYEYIIPYLENLS